MTIDSSPPRSRRWGVLLAVAVVAGVIGWLALSGIGNALVYYKTPSELKAMGEAAIGQPVRVGGLVVPETLTCHNGIFAFAVTDGHTELRVLNGDDFGRDTLICPREGVGVVVEGKLSTLGVFEASQIIIKHDENYVAPSGGAIPSQVIDPGS
jgi:cytochrome c-type biogenesis protein CcmE